MVHVAVNTVHLERHDPVSYTYHRVIVLIPIGISVFHGCSFAILPMDIQANLLFAPSHHVNMIDVQLWLMYIFCMICVLSALVVSLCKRGLLFQCAAIFPSNIIVANYKP